MVIMKVNIEMASIQLRVHLQKYSLTEQMHWSKNLKNLH